MKKGKVRKYIIIGAITIVLGILSFMMYQSNAYYKVNYTGNIINTIVAPFGSYEYVYTGTVQEFTVPATGYYDVELWGANENVISQAKGGYTKGTIYLETDEIIYVVVGGKGPSYWDYNWDCQGEGYNGGGGRQIMNSGCGSAGGGATDVRLISASETDNTVGKEYVSLRSRIMVAAGAGGGGGNVGGVGGSLIGGSGAIDVSAGKGATQTAGGVAATFTGASGAYNGAPGAFGYGGVGGRNWTYNNNQGGSGGGGGYYGGSGGSGSENWSYAGGGGSSYISGYSGVNSVQETGGTAVQPLHTNNTIHYSGKYFIKGSMEAGVNIGNGKAKITYVGSALPQRTNVNLDNVRYIKSCTSGNTANNGKHWVELQAIKDGINVAYGKTVTGSHTASVAFPYSRLTDGDITSANYTESVDYTTVEYTCLTVDLGSEYNLDEIVLWHIHGNGRIYKDNVLSVGAANVSGTISLSMVLHNYPGTTGYIETSEGKRHTVWD